MRHLGGIAVGLTLLVALAFPARLAHDVWVVVVDNRCYDSAREEALAHGAGPNWDDSEAKSRCHIGGDKILFSKRIWAEDPLLLQLFVGIGAAAVAKVRCRVFG